MENSIKLENEIKLKFSKSVSWLFLKAEKRDSFIEVVDGIKYYVEERYFKGNISNDMKTNLREQISEKHLNCDYIINDGFNSICLEFEHYVGQRGLKANFLLSIII